MCDKYDVHLQNNGSKILRSVTFAEKDAAAHTSYLGPDRKLIFTAIVLNCSQTKINMKIMHI